MHFILVPAIDFFQQIQNIDHIDFVSADKFDVEINISENGLNSCFCLCFLLVIESEIPRLVFRIFFLVHKDVEVSPIEFAKGLHRCQSLCDLSEHKDKVLLLILFDKVATVGCGRANLADFLDLNTVLRDIVFIAFKQIIARVSAAAKELQGGILRLLDVTIGHNLSELLCGFVNTVCTAVRLH